MGLLCGERERKACILACCLFFSMGFATLIIQYEPPNIWIKSMVKHISSVWLAGWQVGRGSRAKNGEFLFFCLVIDAQRALEAPLWICWLSTYTLGFLKKFFFR